MNFLQSFIYQLLTLTFLLSYSHSSVFAYTGKPPINDIFITTTTGQVKPGTRCAAYDSSNKYIDMSPKIINKWRINTPKRLEAINIPIAFHIIKSNNNGVVNNQRIYDQINVLNKAYEPLKIKFSINSIDETNNSLYYNMGPGVREFFMKLQLAKSPNKIINVYTLEPSNGILGWASFPWQYDEGSFMHGVVVYNESLPGGNTTDYSLGNTLVHEIGHYLGLYHTFQSGCIAPGDMVDDTPYHADANYGCPVGSNTCPSEGTDPIENFMNYTDDACMDKFSVGQLERMDWAISNFRSSLLN